MAHGQVEKLRDGPPVLFRARPGLIEHIDRCAQINFRSRSAEIRWRLEESIKGEFVDEHGRIVKQLSSGVKLISEN